VSNADNERQRRLLKTGHAADSLACRFGRRCKEAFVRFRFDPVGSWQPRAAVSSGIVVCVRAAVRE
jgi:hypothetical protein